VFGYMPAWSLDGTQIVFGSTHADGYNDLYLINADGTGLRQLTTYSQLTGVDENEPEWMP
jgi:Tol biopolymer transport system component